MLFSSMEFLFLFFPVTLAVCFILPRGARNYWLLAASLFFYAWGEPRFVLVMAASIVFNYAAALVIDGQEKGSRWRRAAKLSSLMIFLSRLTSFIAT